MKRKIEKRSYFPIFTFFFFFDFDALSYETRLGRWSSPSLIWKFDQKESRVTFNLRPPPTHTHIHSHNQNDLVFEEAQFFGGAKPRGMKRRERKAAPGAIGCFWWNTLCDRASSPVLVGNPWGPKGTHSGRMPLSLSL